MNTITNHSNNVLNVIFKGVEEVFNIVKVTYGPLGKNILIKLPKKLLIVDDGVTVVNNIKNNDNDNNIGIMLCQSISNAVNDHCGDGTTTSIVFFYYLLKYSLDKINNGVEPKKIIVSLNNSLNRLLKNIDKYKLNINTTNIENVLMSTTLNYDIIKNVKNAYEIVGSTGLIFLKKTNDFEFIKHIKGYFIYINNIYEKVELNKCKVFLLNEHLYSLTQLKDLDNSKCLIICRSVTDDILKYFKNTDVYICVIKENDCEIIFKDLERLLISNELIDITINNDCLFFHNLSSSNLINTINEEIKFATNLSKINKLKERLAKLTTGIVIIYISGTTEEELENKVLIYEDALKTGYHALNDGACLGAGYIYYLLLKELDYTQDFIVVESLKSMILTLINNTNKNTDDIYHKLNHYTWYDLINDSFIKIENLKVYDSLYSVKEILKTTINNVCLILNTKGIIYNELIEKNMMNEFL